jgi:glycosyltransferase involved in cell wall biosynthesis
VDSLSTCAREHYAVAKALRDQGMLDSLFTDAWINEKSLWRFAGRKTKDRFSPHLTDVKVGSAMGSLALFETCCRIRGISGWKRIDHRNQWFQKQAIKWLNYQEQRWDSNSSKTLFAYSYAALPILRWAKDRGWKTVLGQIDGAIEEENLVAKLAENRGEIHSRSPDSYWNQWRKECAVADKIVVNSKWSASLLKTAGIASDKINVLPLAFQPSNEANQFQRVFQTTFTKQRPLRALFLGLLTARKGIFELLEAANKLVGHAVEFQIVGPEITSIRTRLRSLPNVRFVGAVPRSETGKWYSQADVFMFPTHSDGFGLTQLEAQAWRLPIIASKNCGDVVLDDVNGQRLESVSSDAIADAIRLVLDRPSILKRWSRESVKDNKYSLASLGQGLVGLDL